MTVARVSQVAVEALRTNTAPNVRASQVAVEVLRINTGINVRASQIVVEVLRPNAEALAESASRPQLFVCT